MIFFLCCYLIAGLGVNLGYHRVLSHGSLRIPKGLERFLVTLGLPAGTPVQWAGNHRFHHANTDTEADPHSPRYQGFLYAHAGWYIGTRNRGWIVLYMLAGPARMLVDAWMRPRTNQEYSGLARDVAADPYYRWLSRPLGYGIAMHVYLFALMAAAGFDGVGVAMLWITLVFLYNLADGIDSVAHTFGTRLASQEHLARNSMAMGLLVLGEGWHANHHAFPRSARHGLLPGQFDLIWLLIRGLRAVGLATRVQLPTDQEIQRELVHGSH